MISHEIVFFFIKTDRGKSGVRCEFLEDSRVQGAEGSSEGLTNIRISTTG